jgi:superfamily II DNA or RNA helicase
VIGATTASLTQQGYLVPAICYAPFVPDLKGVKTKADGDWLEDALAELMGDADIVGDVVENWLKLAEGRQTIVFAANVAHSRLLNDAFQRAGIKSAHIDGYERDLDVRTATINAFRAGKINVLCNVGVLTKGFDAPETSCIVIARPTKSLMLHVQMIGRGLRLAEGKRDCIVIDHAGNCLRNGLPTDDLPQELDDGTGTRNLDRKQREKKEPLPSACSSCGFVSTKHKCPACGFAPEARKDVDVIDGELYEITTANPKEWTPEKLARLYAEFLGYARERNYSPGWAFHKCREYVGRAPKATKSITAIPPSEETRRIITHLNIKNAKRRAA